MIKEAIIFLGPPGGGKGTQARLLSETFSIQLIGMGDLLRKEISMKGPNGKKLSAFMDRGEMPPWQIVRQILEESLKKMVCPTVIFDGVPRNQEQLQDINMLFHRNMTKIVKAFQLDVPRAELERRIKERYFCLDCGTIYSKSVAPKIPGICNLCQSEQFAFRKDDQHDIIARRLDIYERDIEPLLSYYYKKESLRTLDGTRPIKELHSLILRDVLSHSSYIHAAVSHGNEIKTGLV